MVKNIWEKIVGQLAEQTTVNFIESEFRLCQGEETGVWRKVNCKMLSDTRLLSRLYWAGRGEVKLNIYQQFYIIPSDVCLSSYIHCSIIQTAWPILPGNGNSCYEIEIKVRVCKEVCGELKERKKCFGSCWTNKSLKNQYLCSVQNVSRLLQSKG